MTITIITVVFNNRSTIEDAIKSVINQTCFKSIEYIIIDGASSDGTMEIINQYKDKISILVSEKDLGIYDAMNKGISLANGDIIGILNSDDIYNNSDILSKIIDQFTINPNLDLLYGNLVYVNQTNINKIVRKWNSTNYYNNFFEDGNVPPHPSLFVKRKIYNKIGSFNITYKFAADYDFMLRVFKSNKYNIQYFPHIIVKMRLGGATNKNFKNIFLGNREILKSWTDNNLKPPLHFMFSRFIKRIKQYF